VSKEEEFRRKARKVIEEYKKKIDEFAETLKRDRLFIVILAIPYAIETHFLAEEYNIDPDRRRKIIGEILNEVLGIKE